MASAIRSKSRILTTPFAGAAVWRLVLIKSTFDLSTLGESSTLATIVAADGTAYDGLSHVSSALGGKAVTNGQATSNPASFAAPVADTDGRNAVLVVDTVGDASDTAELHVVSSYDSGTGFAIDPDGIQGVTLTPHATGWFGI